MLTNPTVYAIRACIYIAAHKDDKYISISEISDKLGISFHFLTKILQKLTHSGLLTSYRGPNGGVAFTKDISEIYLIHIVEAVESDSVFTSCILGIPACGDRDPCPLHDDWGPIRSKIRSRFEAVNLADLAYKVAEFNERLK